MRGVGRIPDVETGFEDGVKLAHLLEQVGNEQVPHINPRPKITAMKLDNITQCLQYCERRGIDVRGYSATDIQQGNRKMIFGLLFKIMLKLNPQSHSVLYSWVQNTIKGQPGFEQQGPLTADDFADGRIFAGILNSIDPGCVRLEDLNIDNREEALEHVFSKIEDVMDIGQALQPTAFNKLPVDDAMETRLLAYLGLIKDQEGRAKQAAFVRTQSALRDKAAADARAAKEKKQRELRDGARDDPDFDFSVLDIEFFTNDLPVEERASALAAMPPLARAQVLAQLSPEYRVQSFGPMNDQDLTAALAALSPADYAATLAAMKPDARVRAQKLHDSAGKSNPDLDFSGHTCV